MIMITKTIMIKTTTTTTTTTMIIIIRRRRRRRAATATTTVIMMALKAAGIKGHPSWSRVIDVAAASVGMSARVVGVSSLGLPEGLASISLAWW